LGELSIVSSQERSRKLELLDFLLFFGLGELSIVSSQERSPRLELLDFLGI
jgi:hypothetical protein